MGAELCDLKLIVVEPGHAGFIQSTLYILRWEAKIGDRRIYKSDDFNIGQTSYIDETRIRPGQFDEVDEMYNRMLNYLEGRGWRPEAYSNEWVSQMKRV